MDRVKCPLRVHLTTGGDWWITPEGVPRVPPLAGCSAAGRNMGGGRHPTRPGLSPPASTRTAMKMVTPIKTDHDLLR
jgi:hypothetical protein